MRLSLGNVPIALALCAASLPSNALAQAASQPASGASGASASAAAPSTAATPGALAAPNAPPRGHRRPWVIFDPVYSRYSLHLAGGPVWWRPARDSNRGDELGFHVGIGASQETQKKHFFVGARVEVLFYALDGKSFALTLPRYSYIAGLRLGPLEPEVGASMTLITADAFHGNFSAGLFSPGAHAGLGVVAGPFRITAAAFTEYRWRWFGDVNYFFRGLALTVDLERPGL
jgi:hypothetical protein